MTKVFIYKEMCIIEELKKINAHHYPASWSSTNTDGERNKATYRMIEALIEDIKKSAEVTIHD